MRLIAIWGAITFWVIAIILHWIPDPAPTERGAFSNLERLRWSAMNAGFVLFGLSLTGAFV